MKLSFKQKIVTGFAIACVFLLALGLYSYYHSKRYVESSKLVVHTHEVLTEIEYVLAATVDFETAQRGYILTGNEEHREAFYTSKGSSAIHLKKLRGLISDNQRQVMRFDSLVYLINNKLIFSEGNINIRREDSMAFVLPVNKVSGRGKRIMDSIRQVIKSMQDEEYKLLNSRLHMASEQEVKFNMTFNVMLISLITILGIVGVFIINNTNARNRTEDKLVEQSRVLEQSNKDLEAFTYSVSHDLRAPLRSIHGYTQILKEDYAGKFDEEGIVYMNVIANNAKKMASLIDDLLAFSRVGKIEITKSKIDVNQLVDGVVKEQLNSESNSEQIKISIAKLPDCYADLSMLRQVWINLISNAVKYSSKNEITKIEIGGKVENDEIVYHVKDYGVGFDMKFGHKLFGVFQRLHKMDEYEGTGVGLSIVHRIITRHGGRVWAEAKINEGACFYFTIPIVNSKKG